MTGATDDHRPARRTGLWTVVGFLVGVEVASGILQGYYTPIFSDIARHLRIRDADVNWFEAAQLVVSALVVPLLARLGDLVGHRRVLLLSTAVTALGVLGGGVRAELLDVPGRLGAAGLLRRLAAARGRASSTGARRAPAGRAR